ncbi:hypothetical protein SAMN05660690_4111 [Geodermatophilus telluris]|uniref:Antitoxin Xre/MbcA/ParS-like toxin-binding domain-containing protein n=1 Tax=Geodermatophilus telluris TaxID=1190417 RepID=A0A1G6UA72_9ACTN|nr:hypothetical protein [Geodermatophilus telluris]SDD37596.1 hypothetical protein SAMN05660690_4111 [Geodermatophilus telluris]
MSAPTTPGIATLKGATAAKVAKDCLHLKVAPRQKDQLVVAVAASDATEAAELVDLITAAKSVLGRERGTLERVLQALLPAKSYTNSSPAVLEQVQRNAEARAQLADEFGLLSSGDVAKLAGSTASNPAALANRWRTEGKVFTVDDAGSQRFPGFQFGKNGRPLPVIAEILAAIGERLTSWELALWFTSSSDWLGGELRPVDVLDSDPELVVRAASALAGELLA